jgi:hypothetical protein
VPQRHDGICFTDLFRHLHSDADFIANRLLLDALSRGNEQDLGGRIANSAFEDASEQPTRLRI